MAEYLDFLGETPDDYVNPSSARPVQAPAPRPTTPDGLRYLDGAKEATPLYYRRQQALSGDPQAVANLVATDRSYHPSGVRERAEMKFDPVSGTYYRDTGGSKPGGLLSFLHPGGDSQSRRQYVTNNPAASGNAPTFSIGQTPGYNAGASPVAQGVPLSLSAGDGSVPGRVGTQQEAEAGNARYQATGNSTPANGDYLSRPPIQNPYAVSGAGYGGGAPPPAAPGPTTLPEVPGPERPDSFRSDKVAPQIQALLDAERRQGPSQAEALLHKATDRIAAQSLGIAAGARGGAGARERAGNMAKSTSAAAGAQASSDIAALRAREDADSRARQQAIMGLISGNAQAGDTRDLGYYSSDQSRASSRENLGAQIASNESQSNADRTQRAFDSEQERLSRAFEGEQSRGLTRDQFNAQQPAGIVDDPLAWLFNKVTQNDYNPAGSNLRTRKI